MLGEVGIFLTASSVIERPRPPVPHLDPHAPPTSSFPSGHTAASSCLYLALMIVVIGYGRGWWRWLALIPGIGVPALVALSRLYRGEHHPTDVLGSAVLAVLWLTVTTKVLKPGSEPGSAP
jgi:undecaprenyl-diphosphatase